MFTPPVIACGARASACARTLRRDLAEALARGGQPAPPRFSCSSLLCRWLPSPSTTSIHARRFRRADSPLRKHPRNLHPADLLPGPASAGVSFSQGFRLICTFAEPEAGRSFREAQRRDPNCAICYWGEAWAWGSYVNGRMTAQQAPLALRCDQKALSLAGTHANGEGARLHQAMAKRYVAAFDPAGARAQDAAYAQAMKRVAEDSIRTISTLQRYTRKRRSCCCRARARSTSATRTSSRCWASSNARSLATSVIRAHAISTSHDRADDGAGARGRVRRLSRERDARSQSSQSHAFAHLEQGRPLGRRGEGQPAGMGVGSKSTKGEGIIDLPRARPADARVRGVDGWSGSARASSRARSRETGARSDVPTRWHSSDSDASTTSRRWDRGRVAIFRAGCGNSPRATHNSGAATARSTPGARPAAGYRQSVQGRLQVHPVKTLLGIVGGFWTVRSRRAAGDLTGAAAAFERAVSLQDALLIDEPEPLAVRRPALAGCLSARGRSSGGRRADLLGRPCVILTTAGR